MRRRTWWIKFQNPATGEILRESLETRDPARAELLRKRLELEVALLDPRFQAVEVPEGVRRLVPALTTSGSTTEASVSRAAPPRLAPALPPATRLPCRPPRA